MELNNEMLVDVSFKVKFYILSELNNENELVTFVFTFYFTLAPQTGFKYFYILVDCLFVKFLLFLSLVHLFCSIGSPC